MSGGPAGAPATINGVLHQMLWSLLQTTNLRAKDCKRNAQSQAIEQATLILEPSGGGGDLRLPVLDGVFVDQVKARTTGKPWSLGEIIESVLPDLFLAVHLDDPDARYRFVTKGRMGGWKQVHEFFESLRTRDCPDHGILFALDDVEELRFRRSRRPAAT